MKNYLLIILLSGLFACAGKETKELYGLPVESIDLHAYAVKSIDELPADVWGETEYILLNADKTEDLFARAGKIRMKDGKIYILDKRLREHYLLVYDMNGNALGRIGSRGEGPEEYIHITDFDIAEDGSVYMMDAYMGVVTMHHFDPDFRFIDKTILPFQADLFACLPGGRFLFSLSTWNSGIHKGERILVTDAGLNPLHSYMEYGDNYDDNVWLSSYALVREGDKISLHRPVEEYVYILSETGEPEKIYEVDFGSYTIPLEIRQDLERHLQDIYDKYKFLRNFVWINDRLIIGKMSDRKNIRMFVADRVNRIRYESGPINEDDYTYLVGYEDGCFISYIEPDRFITDEERLDYLPGYVKTHLSTDNPVLTIRRLKERPY